MDFGMFALMAGAFAIAVGSSFVILKQIDVD